MDQAVLSWARPKRKTAEALLARRFLLQLKILDDSIITHPDLRVIGKIAPRNRTWNRTLRFHRAVSGAFSAVLVRLIILDNIIVPHFHSHVYGGFVPLQVHLNRTWNRTFRFQFGESLPGHGAERATGGEKTGNPPNFVRILREIRILGGRVDKVFQNLRQI